jgi:hypothetical protein
VSRAKDLSGVLSGQVSESADFDAAADAKVRAGLG